MERKDEIRIEVFEIIRKQERLQMEIRKLQDTKEPLVRELEAIEAKEK